MGDEVRQLTSATFVVKVAGSAIPDDVEALMSHVVVEDNLNLPDMFYLSFHDPQRIVLAKGGFGIGAKVEVSVASEAKPGGQKLVSGEVTALESGMEDGEMRTIVRGFDQAHRLYAGRRNRVFLDVTYGDVVRKVASGCGLTAGTVQDPPGGPHPVVSQMGVNDAEFLASLAGETGYMLVVRDGKVSFEAPPRSAEAPGEAHGLAAGDPLQLVQGDNLLRYTAFVTASGQVGDVSVRSWDPKTKRAIVGHASAGTTAAQLDRTSPAKLASAFANATFTAVDVPYGNQSQAETAAKALAEQIGGGHAQLEGVARGNPELRAGKAVSLGLVGDPFDGKYTLTATSHTFDNGAYLTHFSCTGRHERSLQSLTAGGGPGSSDAAAVTNPVPGAVSALVKDVKDPENLGRVKVTIPRFGDDFETGWMRVVQAGAGSARGSFILPEVGDEVLVCFEHGDLRQGYVLGGLYNGTDKPNGPAAGSAVDSGSGKIVRRAVTSRKGHFLLISDKDGEEFVEVATVGSDFSVRLDKDKGGGAVLVTSKNKITIDAKGDITVTGKGKVTVEATQDLTLKGMKVAIEGQTEVQIKGTTVKIQGTAQTEVSGAQTAVKGSAMLDLDGGAIANLKAALVKIN